MERESIGIMRGKVWFSAGADRKSWFTWCVFEGHIRYNVEHNQQNWGVVVIRLFISNLYFPSKTLKQYIIVFISNGNLQRLMASKLWKKIYGFYWFKSFFFFLEPNSLQILYSFEWKHFDLNIEKIYIYLSHKQENKKIK